MGESNNLCLNDKVIVAMQLNIHVSDRSDGWKAIAHTPSSCKDVKTPPQREWYIPPFARTVPTIVSILGFFSPDTLLNQSSISFQNYPDFYSFNHFGSQTAKIRRREQAYAGLIGNSDFRIRSPRISTITTAT